MCQGSTDACQLRVCSLQMLSHTGTEVDTGRNRANPENLLAHPGPESEAASGSMDHQPFSLLGVMCTQMTSTASEWRAQFVSAGNKETGQHCYITCIAQRDELPLIP